MRKLFWILAILFLIPGVALANPWLVCDPQSDASGYSYSLDGSQWTDVVYETATMGGETVAKISDLQGVSVGSHSFQVKAFANDPIWGRLESTTVPFVFTRPSGGAPPGNLKLRLQ